MTHELRRMTDAEVGIDIAQHQIRELVATENRRQLLKWGVQQHDPSFWFLILAEEMGELAAALLSEDPRCAVITQEQRGILLSTHHIGVAAQMVLEGKLPDRANLGMGGFVQGHGSGEETLHVAAVAVAMEESRRRMILEASDGAEALAW